MAKYRQLHTSFWQDGFVLDLTPEEKYFYLYIMTNPKTSQCGIYELPKRIIEIETGYNRETIQKLLQRFVDYKKIDYFEGTKELMINNWIKYNQPNNKNSIKCIVSELKQVKYEEFTKLYLSMVDEYLQYDEDGLLRGLQGAYKGLPSNKIINNKEEIKSNKEEVITAEETSATKDIKKDIINSFTDNEDLKQAIKDFKDMRKQIKKPMTDKAVKLILNELNKLATNDEDKISILNQSIQNSWQGVFPLKNQTYSKVVKPSGWNLKNQRQIEPGLEEKLLAASSTDDIGEDPLELIKKYREGAI